MGPGGDLGSAWPGRDGDEPDGDPGRPAGGRGAVGGGTPWVVGGGLSAETWPGRDDPLAPPKQRGARPSWDLRPAHAAPPESPEDGGDDADDLPRRVRRASLAPQLLADPETAAADDAPPPRDPEEARATMTAFRSGWIRGRRPSPLTPLPDDRTAAAENHDDDRDREEAPDARDDPSPR
ncbi:hypothetical protein BIV57_19825 [Mangrovactinospora gilvigrisea]|uniref:Uncharacterized protein n=1 Tax=Mangrovactinospora gilvigrisea TaxID=1428644 RepID=A0A1J7BQK1_9ACTN|nr:hypothetical protein [Mangrovactinospora gilvigrisea]OIV35729.1 hypothetical protein BIV57_19825 [Mangrovactinospora gilvigrisea]